MKNTLYNIFGRERCFFLCLLLCFCFVFVSLFYNLDSNPIVSYASFKCPNGYSYFSGSPVNNSKPLPHNCTKADEMMLVCENDYLDDLEKVCRRDLVVYRCPIALKPSDFVIHQSVANPRGSASQLNYPNIFDTPASSLANSPLIPRDPATYLPDEYKTYGDLCTDVKYKNNFSVGNICNSKVFGDNPNSLVKPINLNASGIPLPDQNGLVSYFDDPALKSGSSDYNKLKADLYDIFNNDSSFFANQFCRAPTKALRANINKTSSTPPCFLGIGCGPTKYRINEIVADVADTCNIQAGTCKSIIRCIRSIHKCEPQDITIGIGEFTYYIGQEYKDGNGAELSNGRAVQFEPDYENLPTQNVFLPNTNSTTICPNSLDWRPFFVAAKTDFVLYDTGLMQSKSVTTPFLCVKKGFDLKAAYTLLRDANQDCGGRTRIYADSASNDDSAFIICTPPLTSNIKVPVCPGGSSIKIIGDYNNIQGNKCYKSIPPEVYIVDEDVVGKPNCSPSSIKPNSKLSCIFTLSKASFAGYNTSLDITKLATDSSYQLPTNTEYESCKVIPTLGNESSPESIKQRNDEIYYNRLLCIALTNANTSQQYSGHFALGGTAKIKILNSSGSVLATSDLCEIPSNITESKTQYENLLVCKNINVGEKFEEGDKNIVLQLDDFNFTKGTIEAKLGGCTEGVADIYNCYQCLSGTKYTTNSECFQPGQSTASKDAPITATKNKQAPIIPVQNETLPAGSIATLTPEGCTPKSTDTIKGRIQIGGFVPDSNQKIPDCAKTGETSAILETNGIKISIPTNFTDNQIPSLGVINPTPVPTKIGEAAPIIELPDNTLPDGTPATFTPNGASSFISGVIRNNQFVPNPGQIISVGSTVGLAIGVIKTANSTTGVLVNIQATPELLKKVPFVRTGGAMRK